MQEPSAYSPAQSIDQNSFLSRRYFYIVALIAVTTMVMIGFALIDMQYGASTSSSFSSSASFHRACHSPREGYTYGFFHGFASASPDWS
jgi:hypothetical protein